MRTTPKKAEPADVQHERFIETAHDLECDDNKESFEAKLGRIAKAKPARPASPKSAKK
jgi:hypothetical protein